MAETKPPISLSYGSVIQALPLSTSQTVSYTGSSAQSSATESSTEIVRLVATTDCHIKFGSNPTASTSDPLLPANSPEYFKVTGGNKVAAIRASTDGTLHVTECGE